MSLWVLLSCDSSVIPFGLLFHPTPVLALNFIAYQHYLLGCSVNLFTLHHASEILIPFTQQNIPIQLSLQVHTVRATQLLIPIWFLAQPLHHKASWLLGELSKGTKTEVPCKERHGFQGRTGQALCSSERTPEQMCSAGFEARASFSGKVGCCEAGSCSVDLTRVMFHAVDHALFNCQSSNLYELKTHIPNIFLKYKVGQKKNVNADNFFPSPVLADAFSSPEFGLELTCSLSSQRR